MAKVECEISAVEIENEEGRVVDGVCAECSRCGHRTESYGESERSVNRCLALLKEQCPEGEVNFYVAADDEWI